MVAEGPVMIIHIHFDTRHKHRHPQVRDGERNLQHVGSLPSQLRCKKNDENCGEITHYACCHHTETEHGKGEVHLRGTRSAWWLFLVMVVLVCEVERRWIHCFSTWILKVIRIPNFILGPPWCLFHSLPTIDSSIRCANKQYAQTVIWNKTIHRGRSRLWAYQHIFFLVYNK